MEILRHEIHFYLTTAKKYQNCAQKIADVVFNELGNLCKHAHSEGIALNGFDEALGKLDIYHAPLFLLRTKVRNAFYGDVFTSSCDNEYDLAYVASLAEELAKLTPMITFHNEIKPFLADF